MSHNQINHIRILLESEFKKINKITPQPGHIQNTVDSMLKCRTPEFGGHLYTCPDEHYAMIHFNSCKKRNCPTCQGAEIKYWEAILNKKVLKTGHYHITFKNPVLMNSSFISNYKEYANLLMDSSRETIRAIFGIELQPGAIIILHTHGKNNEIHPHVHIAVTDGGINSDMKYRTISNELLNPDTMSEIFKKKYLHRLKRRISNGKIDIPVERRSELFKSILGTTGNIFCSSKYTTSEFLIKYFANYSKGAAIKNYDIKNISNDIVTYTSKDKKGDYVTRQLNTETFIKRYLYHIPPDKYNIIRYMGLYAPGSVEKFNSVREQLNQKVYEKPSRSALRDQESPVCPVCEKKLIHKESFYPNSLPVALVNMFKGHTEHFRKEFFEAREQYKGLKFLVDKNKHSNQIVAKRIA